MQATSSVSPASVACVDRGGGRTRWQNSWAAKRRSRERAGKAHLHLKFWRVTLSPGAKLKPSMNRPYSNCLFPLFENKSWTIACTTFHMEMSFIYTRSLYMSCKSNSFSYERLCTRTRFETEAKDNSEMAYWLTRFFPRLAPVTRRYY